MTSIPSFGCCCGYLSTMIDQMRKRLLEVVPQFDRWNYVDVEALAMLKPGTVSDEEIFRKTTTEFSAGYYELLIPMVNTLRREVFANSKK
ncbi:hypothetical protein F5Y12DRAFT_777019 [Xylaria sp. FL1777]|nr:hypothetical protein F5Y12DRAFT_777019 [Xylaria sp. FL1777]